MIIHLSAKTNSKGIFEFTDPLPAIDLKGDYEITCLDLVTKGPLYKEGLITPLSCNLLEKSINNPNQDLLLATFSASNNITTASSNGIYYKIGVTDFSQLELRWRRVRKGLAIPRQKIIEIILSIREI